MGGMLEVRKASGLCTMHALAVGLVLGWVLCVAPGWRSAIAADDPPAPPQIEPGQYLILEAFDAVGDLLSEVVVENTPVWHTYNCGDPLGLEAGYPLSKEEWRKAPVAKGEGAASKVVNCQFALRPPEPTTQCPYDPVHPSSVLYIAELPSGATAILRLQAKCQPAKVDYRFMGLEGEYPLRVATPIEVARIQAQGELPPLDWDNMGLEQRIIRQDIATLIACTDQAGQADALRGAALIVGLLLEHYAKVRGHYPASLDELYTGPQAVIAALPRNPYAWEHYLGEVTTPAGLPTVAYIPEYAADGSGDKPVGYWLAVTGDGTAQPIRALPAGTAQPAGVTMWLELHP